MRTWFWVSVLAGCTPASFLGTATDDEPGGEPVELGGTLGEWSDADLTCDTDRDCFAGETCDGGTCVIERCKVGLEGSTAPMGQSLTFLQENEIGVIDTEPYEGRYWVDRYLPDADSGDGFDYSVPATLSQPVDVAGGNFTGAPFEVYAVAIASSTEVVLPELEQTIDLGIYPEAIAAGDVDGDGLDEIVALSAWSELVACHVDWGSCDKWDIKGGYDPVDVTVGDIDGDSFQEPILLFHVEGDSYLYGFHPYAEQTGEERPIYWSRIESDEIVRISAGDMDGDFIEEVVALKDPGWCFDFFCDDELHLFDAGPSGTFTRRYFRDVEGQTDVQDIEVGDIDRDDVAEIATLEGDGDMTLEVPGKTTFWQVKKTRLSVTRAPNRIAMADHDGDEPRARLVDGPVAAQGGVVPLMVMLLPPYHRDYSDGVSSVSYGEGESVGESFSDTVSLGVSADIGTSPDFFGLFGLKLSAKVDSKLSTTLSEKRSIKVGNRYSVRADPDQFGPHYGAVVVGWGCFEAYKYAVDDPEDHLADGGERADGQDLVVTVPVGGGEALYSTTRYNALAEVMGLPPIEIPVTVGDPSSYPRRPKRLDGSPVPDERLLFPNPESYQVSDVGQVSWRNSVSQSTSKSTSLSTSLGTSAGITAYGVSIGGGVSYGWGEGYSIDVGESAMFIGGLPPLPDNPATPEDEYATHRYSVRPWVYQEEWQDDFGNEGVYWVMTYSIGD